MSWLYSLVFTGLLFSSNSQTNLNKPETGNQETIVFNDMVQDETEKFEQSYPISAKGRVSVSNINGSIVVEAWDRNEVHLEATKIADSKETLDDVEIKVESDADSFNVETEYKEWKWKNKDEKNRNRKLEVQFKLSVPRTAVLNEVETVNGSVTVANFVNYTKISAVNGDVNAANLRGAANLSTVNGEVLADFDRLEQGTKINLSTVNGRVNLTIPSDANATIKADSLNGGITNEFGLPVRKGEYVGRDLYGKVGTGDVQIRLNSVNGSLSINHKKDGKSPSPATNLLPAKRNNDKDWDDDDSDAIVADAQRLDRDVSRAVRNAQKTTAIVTKEALKAVENVKLAGFEDLKIKIDEKAIEKSVEEGLKAEAVALAGLRDSIWLDGSPMIERKSSNFTVKGVPKVTLDAGKCSVRIRGWDKQEIRYVLTEVSGRRGRTPVSINEVQNGSDVILKVAANTKDTEDEWYGNNNERPRIEIFVPRKSNLKITADGEIRLEGVSGEIELIGSDGAIDVRGSDGKLNVSNTDGTIRIVGFQGNLSASTVDGEVYMDGDFSQISGKSTDGKFILTIPGEIDADIMTPNDRIEVEELPNAKQTSSGNWRFGKGDRKYVFSTVDGSVHVQNRDLIMANR